VREAIVLVVLVVLVGDGWAFEKRDEQEQEHE
jgi:hypothetical protein